MDMHESGGCNGVDGVAEQVHLKGHNPTKSHQSTLILLARVATKASGTNLRSQRGTPRKAYRTKIQRQRLNFDQASNEYKFEGSDAFM